MASIVSQEFFESENNRFPEYSVRSPLLRHGFEGTPQLPERGPSMRTRFFMGTMTVILAVDLVAFSAIVFGLNYLRLLRTGTKPDMASILSFWNCSQSIYSFLLCAVVIVIHLLCCIYFMDRTLTLFKRAFSRAREERTEYLRFSGELRDISEKLRSDKKGLHRSRQILSRFLGHLKPDAPKKNTSIFTRRGRN